MGPQLNAVSLDGRRNVNPKPNLGALRMPKADPHHSPHGQ
jgi:hypothetical protein